MIMNANPIIERRRISRGLARYKKLYLERDEHAHTHTHTYTDTCTSAGRSSHSIEKKRALR